MKPVKIKDDYPVWVCDDCAKSAGGKWPRGHLGTFHLGRCGVCGEMKDVTEPRDWGYPKFTKDKAGH